MACKLCGHTIHRSTLDPLDRVFHCPRCGTLKVNNNWYEPSAWLHMLAVLRQLVNGPDTHKNYEQCCKGAENILIDCDPNFKTGRPTNGEET